MLTLIAAKSTSNLREGEIAPIAGRWGPEGAGTNVIHIMDPIVPDLDHGGSVLCVPQLLAAFRKAELGLQAPRLADPQSSTDSKDAQHGHDVGGNSSSVVPDGKSSERGGGMPGGGGSARVGNSGDGGVGGIDGKVGSSGKDNVCLGSSNVTSSSSGVGNAVHGGANGISGGAKGVGTGGSGVAGSSSNGSGGGAGDNSLGGGRGNPMSKCSGDGLSRGGDKGVVHPGAEAAASVSSKLLLDGLGHAAEAVQLQSAAALTSAAGTDFPGRSAKRRRSLTGDVMLAVPDAAAGGVQISADAEAAQNSTQSVAEEESAVWTTARDRFGRLSSIISYGMVSGEVEAPNPLVMKDSPACKEQQRKFQQPHQQQWQGQQRWQYHRSPSPLRQQGFSSPPLRPQIQGASSSPGSSPAQGLASVSSGVKAGGSLQSPGHVPQKQRPGSLQQHVAIVNQQQQHSKASPEKFKPNLPIATPVQVKQLIGSPVAAAAAAVGARGAARGAGAIAVGGGDAAEGAAADALPSAKPAAAAGRTENNRESPVQQGADKLGKLQGNIADLLERIRKLEEEKKKKV